MRGTPSGQSAAPYVTGTNMAHDILVFLLGMGFVYLMIWAKEDEDDFDR